MERMVQVERMEVPRIEKGVVQNLKKGLEETIRDHLACLPGVIPEHVVHVALDESLENHLRLHHRPSALRNCSSVMPDDGSRSSSASLRRAGWSRGGGSWGGFYGGGRGMDGERLSSGTGGAAQRMNEADDIQIAVGFDTTASAPPVVQQRHC